MKSVYAIGPTMTASILCPLYACSVLLLVSSFLKEEEASWHLVTSQPPGYWCLD